MRVTASTSVQPASHLTVICPILGDVNVLYIKWHAGSCFESSAFSSKFHQTAGIFIPSHFLPPTGIRGGNTWANGADRSVSNNCLSHGGARHYSRSDGRTVFARHLVPSSYVFRYPFHAFCPLSIFKYIHILLRGCRHAHRGLPYGSFWLSCHLKSPMVHSISHVSR